MVRLAYNPIKFFPYFRIEKSEFSVSNDNIKLFDKIKDQNGEESIKELDIKFENFKPSKKHHIFFIFSELFLLALCLIYIVFAFLSTQTDIFTVAIWLWGMAVSVYLVKVGKFVLSEIAVSATCLICMISLYIFFKNFEMILNHIGILFVSYFIIYYVLFNMYIKNEIIRSNSTWGKISNYKFFIIFDNGK